VAERLKESLLRQVARLLRVFRQAVEQGVDVAVPLLDQTVEGRRLAAPEPFKELFFGRGDEARLVAEVAASAALSSSASMRRAIGSPKLTSVLRRPGRVCRKALTPFRLVTFDTARRPLFREKVSRVPVRCGGEAGAVRQDSPAPPPPGNENSPKRLLDNPVTPR
jgi:hypothetical protein